MIRSPFVRPIAEIGEPAVEIGLVVAPRQAVHPRSRVPLQSVERFPEPVDVDVVQERGEPRLLTLPCGLSYAVQALWRAVPSLRPERAFLSRVPLGPRPWLHQLRRRLPDFVRWLHRYYGGARLLTPVHHALRLFSLPHADQTANGLWPGVRSPRFRRDPFVRDLALDPGRATAPRITAPHTWPSTKNTGSALRHSGFRGSIPHPTRLLCTLHPCRRRQTRNTR